MPTLIWREDGEGVSVRAHYTLTSMVSHSGSYCVGPLHHSGPSRTLWRIVLLYTCMVAFFGDVLVLSCHFLAQAMLVETGSMLPI